MARISKKNLSEYITGYSFILPGIIFVLTFIAFPIIASLLLSFFKWPGYGDFNFIGFKNYIKTFTADRFFYDALKNSIIFSISTTLGTVVIGFILAVIIDLKVKFWKIYRFIYFLPFVIAVVPLAFFWTRVFDPNGLANYVLGALHLEALQRTWLGETGVAMFIVILVTVWQYSGFPMIFFLAGMQNIDEEIYEAAKIDGASTFRSILVITIPLLRYVFSIIIMLQLIFSFKVFDIIWVMTRGGPAHSTEVLGTMLYQEAFGQMKFGYASVVSVVMFLVSLILAFIYVRVSGYTESVLQK